MNSNLILKKREVGQLGATKGIIGLNYNYTIETDENDNEEYVFNPQIGIDLSKDEFEMRQYCLRYNIDTDVTCQPIISNIYDDVNIL